MIRVALLPGDGIGAEVTAEARRVLEAVSEVGSTPILFEEYPHGAEHFLATGETLGDEAFHRLRDEHDAILLGALGDPRVPDDHHARDILLGLRSRLDLFTNFRPLRLRARDLSPLALSEDDDDIDFVIFRENTEGFYTGAGGTLRRGTPDEVAVSESFATRFGVDRIVRAAFDYAVASGRTLVTLADKSNAVPHVFGLWRRAFFEIAEAYPGIDAEARYVDALAMELVRSPTRFQVIVAENMLADILSDLGAELIGGLGLAPSANLHPGRTGLYEPVHGSAPDLAGRGIANPMAAVLSGALLLRDHGDPEAADAVDAAVDAALAAGIRTPDVGGSLSTREVGEWLANAVASNLS